MNAFNPTAPLLPPSHAHGDELHFSLYCIFKSKVCVKLFFSLFKKRLNRSFFHKKSRDIVPFHNLLASNPLSSDPRSSNPRSSDPRSSNPRSSNPLLSNLSHPINSHPIHTRPNHSHPIVSHLAHSHPTHYHIFNSHPIHTHPNHSHPAHSHPIDSHPTHYHPVHSYVTTLNQSTLIQLTYYTFNPFSSKSLLANLLTHTLKTNFHPISQ